MNKFFKQPIVCECEAMGVGWSFDVTGPSPDSGDWPITGNYRFKYFLNHSEYNLMLDFPVGIEKDCDNLLNDAINGKVSRMNPIIKMVVWSKLMRLVNSSEEYKQAIRTIL